MMRLSLGTLVSVGLFGAATSGCASSPVAPFNAMEKANVVVFRLQNYEPPSVLPTASAAGGNTLLQGLPNEVQAWLKQGAQGLQQILPGVVLPPVLGGQQAATTAPAQSELRFHGSRILGQNQVMDSELRASLGKLFGNADNFEPPKAGCLYPDYGISFGPTPGAPTYDFVISTTCHQVQPKTFQWPHSATGMTVALEEDWAELVRKMLPN